MLSWFLDALIVTIPFSFVLFPPDGTSWDVSAGKGPIPLRSAGTGRRELTGHCELNSCATSKNNYTFHPYFSCLFLLFSVSLVESRNCFNFTFL